MAKYLVIFKDQLDGVDVNGFKVMSDRDLTDFEHLAENINWGFSYTIGETKLFFENGEDFLTRLEYKEVTIEEGQTFKKLFGGEFGVFIDKDFIDGISREESEDEITETNDEGLPYYGDEDDDF